MQGRSFGNIWTELLHKKTRDLEKGFQKKTIVAFTNSMVIVLDFNVYYYACLVSCSGLETLDFEKSS